LKVFQVPGYDGQAMFDGSGPDPDVFDADRVAFRFERR
jgi:hypothetical protein